MSTRVLVPVLAGVAGYAAGLMSGRKDQSGNAVLYWLLIAALVLGLLAGGVLLYKRATNG